MRRTTICRSSGARLAAAAVLLAAAVPLAAQQQPTQPQRPAQQTPPQRLPAAQLEPLEAAPQGRGQVAVPPTHVVQEGETLWSLAEQYFGDPLLWPEIYRLNTAIIEDPHWIFPGEELRLVLPEEPAGAAPAADSAPGAPPSDQGPTIFARTPGQTPRATPGAATIQVTESRAYRAVREGEYYASGFIAAQGSLVPGAVGATVERSSLSRLTMRTSVRIYGTVFVTPPPGETLQSGDLLLTYEVDRRIREYGEVVLPTGLLRVTSAGAAGARAAATVVAMYGTILSGQSLIKTPAFSFSSSTHAVPTDSGVVAEVIGLRSGRELVSTQEVLYINRGADDGVRLGDVFHITSVPDLRRGGLVRDQADVMVVYTRPSTATCVVIEVSQPDIRPGAAARQVRRMPS